MNNNASDLEKFRQILSDLPEYDEADSFDQDSAYDEAKQIADWFQKGLQTSDDELDQEQTEEIEHDWQQHLLDKGNNGVVEFRNIVKSIPRDVDFDDVSQTLCKLQEMEVKVIFSYSHWREKTFLMEELAELAQDCDHNVRLFLDEISHYPFLNKKKEWGLIFLAQHENIEARNRIVLSYLQYVVNLAKHYVDSDLSFMDLIQEGCLGLIEAIDRNCNVGFNHNPK